MSTEQVCVFKLIYSKIQRVLLMFLVQMKKDVHIYVHILIKANSQWCT